MRKLSSLRAAVCVTAALCFSVVAYAQSLPSINNLQFHLDASTITGLNNGEAMTSWTDLVHGNNVTQGDAAKQPTYVSSAAGLNGQPAVYFGGANYLTNEGWNLITGNAARTVIAVWADATDNGYNNQHALSFGEFADKKMYSLVPFNGAAGNRKLGYHYHTVSGATYIDDAAIPTLSMNYYNGATDYITGNGLLGKVNAVGLDTGSTRLVVGAHTNSGDNNGEPMKGNIAEVLVYDRKLTTKEQQQVGSYLTEKYNLNTTYLAAGTQNVTQTFGGLATDTKYAVSYFGPNATNNGYDTSTAIASAPGCGLQANGTFRLLSRSNYMKNTLYFNNEGYGSNYAVAQFDLSMLGNDPADGLNFSLANTNLIDLGSAFSDQSAEGSGLAGSLSLAFGVNGSGTAQLYWNGAQVGSTITNELIRSGKFFTANVSINYANDGAYVKVTLMDKTNGDMITVTDTFIAGMEVYNNSVLFSGRTGGRNVDADLDNIRVIYSNAADTIRWAPDATGSLAADGTQWENNLAPTGGQTAQIYAGANSVDGNVQGFDLLVTGGTTTRTAGDFLINSVNSLGGNMTLESGTFTVNGKMAIANPAGTSGSLTINGGSFYINGTNQLNVIGDNGLGTLTVNGGRYEYSGTGDTVIGYGNAGDGAVAVNDGYVKFGGAMLVGRAGKGVVKVDGGVTTVVGALTVGTNANSEGAFSMNGGEFYVTGKTVLGSVANSTGTMTINGGYFKTTPSSHNVIGDAGTGSVTLNGGLYEVVQSGVDMTTIGYQNSGKGTFTINNGTAKFGNSLLVGRDGEATMTINGGTLSVTGALEVSSNLKNNENLTGKLATLEIKGGTTTISGNLRGATATKDGVGGNAKINITGGTITAAGLELGVAGNSTVDFAMSGGSLTAGGFTANTGSGSDVKFALSDTANMTINGTFVPMNNTGTGRFVFSIADDAVLKVSGNFWGGSNNAGATALIDPSTGQPYEYAAYYTFSGDSKTSAGEFWIGMSAKTHILIEDNATITSTNNNAGVGWNNNGKDSLLEMTGGTFNVVNFKAGESTRAFAEFTGGKLTSTGYITVGDNGAAAGSSITLGGWATITTPTLNVKNGTFEMDGGTLNATTISISEGSSVFNLAGGTLNTTTLNKTNGAFNFTDGTLNATTINFNLEQNGGTLSPGGDGKFGTTTINGGYTLNEGTIHFDISADNWDKLFVTGAMILGDDVTFDLSFDLAGMEPDSTYEILRFGAGSDLGDISRLLTGMDNYFWNIDANGGSLWLTLDANAVPEPATWVLLGLSVLAMGVYRRRKAA